ncbi:hypothetical protein [Spirosoma fluminis]
MKKGIAILAILLGFAAEGFAQVGQGQCAVNIYYITPEEKQPVMQLGELPLLGISDAEGDPIYSVTMKADFTAKKVSNLVVTEIKTGKKWLMNQVAMLTTPVPFQCKAGDLTSTGMRIHKGVGTNLAVYVSVPDQSGSPIIYLYKPPIQNFAAKL